MSRLLIYCLCVGTILNGVVRAQTPARFEVASIKSANPDAQRTTLKTDPAGGLIATNIKLRYMITIAYGIRDFQLVGGPDWINTDRYDIFARTDGTGDARDQQNEERLRALLAERFGLVVHSETKEQPVYILSVAKNGPKLTPVTVPGDREGTSDGRGRSQGFAATMPMLAKVLSNATGRPVVDRTGLAGKYDYVLEFASDAASDGSGPDRPAIFTAVQEQLGLKLEAGKAPVEAIVIDHVERPSAN